MKEYFSEVRCDYINGEGFWTVDAWLSSDPDAEGEVIAAIHSKTGDVFYSNTDARISPKAQEAIKEKVDYIRQGNAVTDDDNNSSPKRIFTVGQIVFWADDHLSGWGKVTGVRQKTNHRGEFIARPDEPITVSKVDGYGEIETTADHLFQLVKGCTFRGKAVVWDHRSEDNPFYCPDKKECLGYDDLDKEKDYEVDIFILGTPPHTTKETVTVKAHSIDEAERRAVKAGSGWGVFATRIAKQ